MIPLLNVYSQFSFLQAVSTPDELVAAAAAAGYQELALTDVNSLHGLVRFVRAAGNAGLRPLPGARVDVTEGGRLLLLSARDGKLAPLITTVNRAALQGVAPQACLEDLIVVAADESLPLSMLRRSDYSGARELLGRWRDILGAERLWLGAAPADRSLWPQLRALARELTIGIAACPPVRWVQPKQALAYQVLQALNPGLPQEQALLPTGEAVKAEYRQLPEALVGTCRVAEMAGAQLDLGQIYLPRFGDDDLQQLRVLCKQGLGRKFPRKNREARERLERELAVIAEMGFAAYFLIAWDLVRFARERGIAVGPGRGSAGGSIVSYVLDITRVNPLEHNLIFERFLNPQRVSLPDIDIDFCYRRRDEVFAYAVERYGRDRTCQVATYTTFGPRGSLRDAGRALGLPRHEVDALCRQVPGRGNLPEIVASSPRLKQMAARPPWSQWFAVAAQLEGRVRHTSVHPAGLLITPLPLDELVPLQRASGGDVCSQWDKDDVEDMGLLKMDLLAVRGLTVNQDVIVGVGRKKAAKDFSYQDSATLRLLQRGETLGCFQLESEGMRGLMRRLHPRALEDVIAVLSLYRPGPWQAGMVERYIERRHGRERVEYYHPDLEPVLRDTYGVLLYQEQVMQVAQIIGGYDAGEADSLRRAIAKLQRRKLEELTREFCKRATARGYPAELAEQLLNTLVEFSGYAFNRAHSAAYGILAMATVYLKAHFPDHFLAAILASRMGYYPLQVYVNEAVRLGLPVQPPCVNRSKVETTVEAPGVIRLGLDYIKGLGAGAQRLVAARGDKPFRSLDDFARRCPPGAVEWHGLISAGALDCLEPNRRALLAALPGVEEKSAGGLLAQWTPEIHLPDLPELTFDQKVAGEYASLGLLLDQRWLEWRSAPPGGERIRAAELKKTAPGKRVTIAAAVVNRRSGYITLDDFSGQIEARYKGPVSSRWVWATGTAGTVLDQVQLTPLELSPDKSGKEAVAR